MKFALENVQIVRNFFAENFPEVKVYRHRAGTLVWVDVRGLGLTEEAVAKWFERAGVEADLGSKYGAAGDGFLRLQIGMPKSELLGALERLKAAWK
jgi:cystathionine beta-lyase